MTRGFDGDNRRDQHTLYLRRSQQQNKETGVLYALICEDHPDSEALRKATRDEHLAFIRNHDVRLVRLPRNNQRAIGPALMPTLST